MDGVTSTDKKMPLKDSKQLLIRICCVFLHGLFVGGFTEPPELSMRNHSGGRMNACPAREYGGSGSFCCG